LQPSLSQNPARLVSQCKQFAAQALQVLTVLDVIPNSNLQLPESHLPAPVYVHLVPLVQLGSHTTQVPLYLLKPSKQTSQVIANKLSIEHVEQLG
jgi:hypothetical protein